MLLHEKLITLRKQHGFTQEQLAQKLNISRQMISKWESGNEKPTLSKLEDIAKIYDIDIQNFFDDTISKQPKDKHQKQKRKTIYAICFIACILAIGGLTWKLLNKSDDTSENTNTVDNQSVKNKKRIIDLEGEFYQEDGHDGTRQYIDIRSDGTFVFNYNLCAGMVDIEGKWTANGSTLKLLSNDGQEYTFMIANKNSIKYTGKQEGCGPYTNDYFSKK